jgi:hypothetical protein
MIGVQSGAVPSRAIGINRFEEGYANVFLQDPGLLPVSWVMRQWPRAAEEHYQLCPA